MLSNRRHERRMKKQKTHPQNKIKQKLAIRKHIKKKKLKWISIYNEEVKRSRSVVSDSLQPHRLQPTRLLGPLHFPGMNTGVGCHFLLQGIFPTRGSKSGLLHCRQTLYHRSYQGSPFTMSTY